MRNNLSSPTMSDTTFIQRLRSLGDSQQATAHEPLVVDFDTGTSRRLLSSPTAWAIVALAAVVIVMSVAASVLSSPESPPLAQQRIAAAASSLSPAVSVHPITSTAEFPQSTNSAASGAPTTPGAPSMSLEPGESASSGEHLAEDSAASQREIVVSVVGPVRYPGLVQMPADARIEHAIDAAGGLVPPGSYEGLNRAQLLVDGMQIVVGSVDTAGRIEPGQPPEPGIAAPNTTTIDNVGPDESATVNLNTATVEQLTQLTGIGPKIAAVIIAWRTEHGPFKSVEQLLDVKGIGPAKLARLRSHVTV